MAEDKVDPRDVNWRDYFPWTTLFQGFWVAMDPKKLVLAAAGILCMAAGWWVIGAPFNTAKPVWPNDYRIDEYGEKGQTTEEKRALAFADFRDDRREWNVRYEAVGRLVSDKDGTVRVEKWEAADFADTERELEQIENEVKTPTTPPNLAAELKTFGDIDRAVSDGVLTPIQGKALKVRLGVPKPYGAMRTLPWYEDRGPNPYLLVTGQAGKQWEKGRFLEWFMTQQVPNFIEPLIKLFLPVKYLFHPGADILTRLCALLLLLWMIAVWALFGGAITRLAVVEVARQEKLSLREAVRFTWRRYLSYFSAPLIPLLFVAALVLLMVIVGLLHMIPVLGNVLDVVLWPIMILFGLGIALILVGLVTWPLMTATISAEGTEAWEAISRAYNFLVIAPWRFIFYSLLAIAYGAVLIFFVGLMGSLAVYLSKWGTSLATTSYRDPSYLFVYAPESYGWRPLLLKGLKVEEKTEEGENARPVSRPIVTDDGQIDENAYKNYLSKEFYAWNYVAAFLVSLWVWFIFLLVLGFGYCYFWVASTIITLLLRRHVEDAEMDEVYLEDEEELAASSPLMPPKPAPAPAPAPAAPATSLPVVEAPRPVATPVAPPAPPPPPPAPEPAPAPTVVTTPPPPPAPMPAPTEALTPPASGDGETRKVDKPDETA